MKISEKIRRILKEELHQSQHTMGMDMEKTVSDFIRTMGRNRSRMGGTGWSVSGMYDDFDMAEDGLYNEYGGKRNFMRPEYIYDLIMSGEFSDFWDPQTKTFDREAFINRFGNPTEY